MKLTDLKVAFVYDHLTTKYGGAELVLQNLLQLFPTAPLYTTVFDQEKVSWVDPKQVTTTFLQRFGFLKRFHQLLLPLHPIAIEQLDLSEFDLIISVSAGTAKGVITHPRQLHVCYLLTPPRYLYMEHQLLTEYAHSQGLPSIPGFGAVMRKILSYIRSWDQVAGERPDKIIAISQLVAERVAKTYKRKADAILYPPFEPLKNTNLNSNVPTFLLSFSRLTSYKKIDLSIKAAINTNSLLVVAGTGPMKNELQNLASKHAYIRSNETVHHAITNAQKNNKLIIFVGNCSETEKSLLFSKAQAVLMPGLEDFGLIGLEAISCGTPVITNQNSGIAELLNEPLQAVFLEDESVTSLAQAITKVQKKKFDATKLKQSVIKHQSKHFKEAFLNTLYQFWHQHSTISPVGIQNHT